MDTVIFAPDLIEYAFLENVPFRPKIYGRRVFKWIMLCDLLMFALVNSLVFASLFNPKKACLKGIVHPKVKMLSSFTHPQVVPNLYKCLCSVEHKGRYSGECWKQSSSGAPFLWFFFLLEVNSALKQPGYKLTSKYLPWCLAEQRNSYKFGTTWGWVNDDSIFTFGWSLSSRW